MSGPVRAARRDASCYSHPGRAWRYHVVAGDLMAACAPARVALTDFTARDATAVPDGIRCQRPGCRARWPKPSTS